MNKKHLNILSKLIVMTAVLLTAVAASAQESVSDDSKCVWREVVVVVKSTRSVHYSEKDEGKLISKYMVKDCGDRIVVDTDTKTPVVPGVPRCPPTVQDCIRP